MDVPGIDQEGYSHSGNHFTRVVSREASEWMSLPALRCTDSNVRGHFRFHFLSLQTETWSCFQNNHLTHYLPDVAASSPACCTLCPVTGQVRNKNAKTRTLLNGKPKHLRWMNLKCNVSGKGGNMVRQFNGWRKLISKNVVLFLKLHRMHNVFSSWCLFLPSFPVLTLLIYDLWNGAKPLLCIMHISASLQACIEIGKKTQDC